MSKRCYLKGYYGYKNFGDELLLFGVISYLSTLWYTHVAIETPHIQWLRDRCKQHQHLYTLPFSALSFVAANSRERRSFMDKVFGWGEVVTDARPFPYNGRNYLLWFFKDILRWKYLLLWGIWTLSRLSTKILYRALLWKASLIVVREEDSYRVAEKYSKHVVQYHDFAYDVLSGLDSCRTEKIWNDNKNGYGIINLTPYLRNDDIKKRIQSLVNTYSWLQWYSFPWEIGVDDKRQHEISELVPWIQRFDRSKYSLEETISFLSGATCALASRLHVLVCLHRAGVPYEPVVYQEKIRKLGLA